MAGEAVAALSALKAVQVVLRMFQMSLQINSYMCPMDDSIRTITSMKSFDFIIVGAGSAGSVLARRLSETNKTILLIESGGCPPIESTLPGYFPMIPLSQYDYNMTSINDGRVAQQSQGNSIGTTAGRMLGGSSGLHHMLHILGSPVDYEDWVKITNNSTFSYDNMLKYVRKSETVEDAQILKEFPQFHGTDGPLKVMRQISKENKNIIDAFTEMGYEHINDNNNNVTMLGIVEPLFEISDGMRQSEMVAYLAPINNRRNLHVLTQATVTKIDINSKKVATGVTFEYKGCKYHVKSNKDVIISAGTMKTPQLLMLSGIGNEEHLKMKKIKTKIHNPYVGENLQEHTAACFVYALEKTEETAPPVNPHKFPVPTTCAYATMNKSQNYPDHMTINLLFPRQSSGFLQLCMNVFKYKPKICQTWYNANKKRNILIAAPNILNPSYRGHIRLNTTSIYDQPLITLNLLNNEADLDHLARYLQEFMMIGNTTYFKSVSAEFVDLPICPRHKKYSFDYWKCYALEMAASMWHYCGTCSLGTCLDASFKVVGANNLRVVDASAIPKIVRAKINTAVVILAELASDIIKKEHSLM